MKVFVLLLCSIITMLVVPTKTYCQSTDTVTIFVSQQTGNDFNGGTTWHDAVKTYAQARQLYINNAQSNRVIQIFFAEGRYDVYGDGGQDITIGQDRNGNEIQYSTLIISGGYKKPDATTIPTDTCNNAFQTNVTEFYKAMANDQSVFRIKNNNNKLIIRGFHFTGENFRGTIGNGPILSVEGSQKFGIGFEVENCIFDKINTARASAFYVYDDVSDLTIRMSHVEVKELHKQSGAQYGGGFVGTTYEPTPYNVKADFDHVYIHENTHRGPNLCNSVIGLASGSKVTTSYVKMDNVYIFNAVNIAAGLSSSAAGRQAPAVCLEGFYNIEIKNSVFRQCNGKYGAIAIGPFVNFVSENNYYARNNGFYGAVDFQNFFYTSSSYTNVDEIEGVQITATFTNDKFDENYGYAKGGAVFADRSGVHMIKQFTFNNCQFTKNYTQVNTNVNFGGAIFLSNQGKANFNNCTFCNNTAGITNGTNGNGGAIAFCDKAGELNIFKCSFDGNQANNKGGVIFTNPGPTGDTLVNINIDSSFFANNWSRDDGGAICMTNKANLHVKHSYFVKNVASNNGGAMSRNSSFNANILIDTCVFMSNTAGVNGGAIYDFYSVEGINNGTISVSNCLFEDNEANVLTGDGNDYLGGGAICASVGTTIKKSRFINNRADSLMGGAISNSRKSSSLRTLSIDSCEFENNVAKIGGAISSFTACQGPSSGVILKIKNSKFSNDTATGNISGFGGGGAICATTTGAVWGCREWELNNNTFIGNSATNGKGGAIFDQRRDLFKSTNNRYYNNTASGGGGAYYSHLTDEGNLAAGFLSEGDVYYGNITTSGLGGALFLYFSNTAESGNVQVKNAFVISNTAGSWGGGIYVKRSGNLASDNYTLDTLRRVAFFGNTHNLSGNKGKDIAFEDNGNFPALPLRYTTGRAYACFFQNPYDGNYTTTTDTRGGLMYYDNLCKFSGDTTGANISAIPATLTGDALNPQGTLTFLDTNSVVNNLVCQEIVVPDPVPPTDPKGVVTTNKDDPETAEKEPLDYSVVSLCATGEHDSTHFVMFQSKSGQPPFTFYYDVYKSYNGTNTKLNGTTTRVIHTDNVPRVDSVPIVAGDEEQLVNDTTVSLDTIGWERINVYADSIYIVNPVDTFETPQVGALYTFVLRKMEDQRKEILYDCNTPYEQNMTYTQNASAQIFFRNCQNHDNDTIPDVDDLDDDNDGIRDTTECPIDTTLHEYTNIQGKPGWFETITGTKKTQTLFKEIVEDPNYMNSNPATGKVLTVFPSVLNINNSNGDVENIDLSTYFGYPANSNAVVVSVYNYLVNDTSFANNYAHQRTRWKVTGNMNPYVLVQSYCKAEISKNTDFGIDILDSRNVMSQTDLYIDTNIVKKTHYQLYEEGSYKRAVYRNTPQQGIAGNFGLSYLNTTDGDKYFDFQMNDTLSTGLIINAVTIVLPCDTDGDGIPDTFDTDSDNDDCFDAREAEGVPTSDWDDNNLTPQGNIKGDVSTERNNMGVPMEANNGAGWDGIGQSQDETLSNACPPNLWMGSTSNDFDTPSNWTLNKVPGQHKKIEFATKKNHDNVPAERDCILSRNDTASRLINETGSTEMGDKKAFIVATGATLVVEDTIIGSGTVADTGKIILKSDGNQPNAGLFIAAADACTMPVYATVEMYSKAQQVADVIWTDRNRISPTRGQRKTLKHTWQFFGIPVVSLSKSTVTSSNPTQNHWMRIYNEKQNAVDKFYQKWTLLTSESTMNAFAGYEVTQDAPCTYTFRGKLMLCDTAIPMTRRAPMVTKNGQNTINYGLGYNIIGNSYTSSLDIKESLQFDEKLEKTAYVYNTGHIKQWQDRYGKTPGIYNTPGSYMAIPQNVNTPLWEGLVPSMQGFLVKFTEAETVVGDSVMLNFNYQGNGANVNAQKGADEAGYVKLVVQGKNTYDEILLVEVFGTTKGYDNGWDGRKISIPGNGSVALYVDNGFGKMQISATNNIGNQGIMFKEDGGEDYTLTIYTDNIGGDGTLRLLDRTTGEEITLDKEITTYTFKSAGNKIATQRFVIMRTKD